MTANNRRRNRESKKETVSPFFFRVEKRLFDVEPENPAGLPSFLLLFLVAFFSSFIQPQHQRCVVSVLLTDQYLSRTTGNPQFDQRFFFLGCCPHAFFYPLFPARPLFSLHSLGKKKRITQHDSLLEKSGCES